ncbi:GGDEF domain-containing protein [Sphingopyxis sp. KK2]|uniref:GGDEF domain-containing protein n=1 Tax=Sphingopyxis sp. KK2 TaxID=1855727 RepID=UPI00097E56DD|nr:GGDEF domain-containing protein [Sphingopyxis sp. KK2]
MGLLLAVAFFLLWMHRRDQHYVLLAGLSYAAMAAGFLILDFAPVLPFEAQRIPANIGFLVAAVLIVGAAIARYRVPVPWRGMAAICAVAMTTFLWYLFIQPSITHRVLVISIALGLVALQLPIRLRRMPRAHLVDHILFWVGVLSATNFIIRPLLIIGLTGGFSTYAGFQQSIYWTTVQFSQAMISILFALCLMVAAAIDLMAELREQADGDALSGLLNRRGFEGAAGVAVRAAADEDRPAALLIADIDHFKAVNDTHGHATGDAIIAAFGAHIRAAGPADMIAGRIGGEEFALLLPGANIESARTLAEAIRTGMAGACAPCTPDTPPPTVSIGLAASVPGTGLSRLMRDADQALYEAKRAGRNRVRAFTPAPVRIAAAPDTRKSA